MNIKNFDKIFNRFAYKQIFLYGLGNTSKNILKKTNLNIQGLIADKKDIGFKKILYSKKIFQVNDIIKFKKYKLYNKSESSILIIIAASNINSKIIYEEIKYLKEFKINIFFLNGKTEIESNKTYNLKKINIDEQKLKKKIIQNDVISFDLYDTLVRRLCSKPIEIYNLLGEFANWKFKIKNFHFIRINIGNKMEINKGQVYNLDEIYNQIFIENQSINNLLIEEGLVVKYRGE